MPQYPVTRSSSKSNQAEEKLSFGDKFKAEKEAFEVDLSSKIGDCASKINEVIDDIAAGLQGLMQKKS